MSLYRCSELDPLFFGSLYTALYPSLKNSKLLCILIREPVIYRTVSYLFWHIYEAASSRQAAWLLFSIAFYFNDDQLLLASSFYDYLLFIYLLL